VSYYDILPWPLSWAWPGGGIVIWAAATVVRAIDDAGQDETSEYRPAA
jgi:hypothetical protein